jgi:lipopolysaccharide transport system permease protein
MARAKMMDSPRELDSRQGCMQETVIRADGRWLLIPWKEIREYKDLFYFLIRRDFLSLYKQTVLGPIWFLLNPLCTTLIFTAIFGRVLKVSVGEVPHVLFYLCSLLPWSYVNTTFSAVAGTFSSNGPLFTKVYFPRLIIPIAKATSNLLSTGIQGVLFLAFWLYFKFFTPYGEGYALHPVLLLLPFMVVHGMLVSVGMGLWLASLTARYRDLHHLSGFLSQLWLYGTPVIYPLSEVPAGLRWIAARRACPAGVLRGGFHPTRRDRPFSNRYGCPFSKRRFPFSAVCAPGC